MTILLSILILINSERIQPLKIDKELSTIAKERAVYLCKNNQWSHEGWKDSFKNLSYDYRGENLAKGFSNIKEMHKGLMASPTHKYNIVNPNYQVVGIGRSCGITVQLFGGKKV